jgi:hypothetical protein
MRTLVHTTVLAAAAVLAFLSAGPVRVLAAAPEAGTAASITLETRSVSRSDARTDKLESYLSAHSSPLAPYSGFFVQEADRLGLDWKLVVSIAGAESTFGQFVPANSYNGWGWGIFTGRSDGVHFSSWADGITTVSEGLRYNYINHGAVSVEEIGRVYAASPAWAAHVRFFMREIDAWQMPENHTEALSMLTL